MKRLHVSWLMGLLLLLSFVACNPDSKPDPTPQPSYPSLMLAANSIYTHVHSQEGYASIAIQRGSGHYSTSVDKPEIAKAWIAESRLCVRALSIGSCVVTVTDTKTKEQIRVTVTVAARK